ncbi:DUF2309 domain-containing protein [Microbulbifer variabilis]|uniref:DUF2309 domain-containing protein n=1 Tax=Microbulbifer variabilis TaxID=266805 RepID=UPI001CFD4679|nr:DUF2309 domain-containing protein [Microbulbifer variabilis]
MTQPASIHAPLVDQTLEALQALIEEVSHWLPSQPPLHAFVHHNTLHQFEQLPFEEAVVAAATLFGTEPFLDEDSYRQFFEDGRISERDLHSVLADQYADASDDVVNIGLTRTQFRFRRMTAPFKSLDAATVNYLCDEQRIHQKLDHRLPLARRQQLCLQWRANSSSVAEPLSKLWSSLVDEAIAFNSETGTPVRLRDLLLPLSGVDTDEIVHPLLIRLCGAFLDQGVAHWPMPQREEGLLVCFRKLYQQPFLAPNPALAGLRETLKLHQKQNLTALQTIAWALNVLAIGEGHEREFLLQSLLALRGWAGMFFHLQQRPDHAPVHEAYARIEDFLAVRLLLEVTSAQKLMQDTFGQPLDWQTLRQQFTNQRSDELNHRHLPLAYESFLAAQHFLPNMSVLANVDIRRYWLAMVHEFGELDRRKVWHLSYEHHYQAQVLDALTLHTRYQVAHATAFKRPVAQAVFCIDDREESLRRHLEETLPQVETFGFAGFFGAAIEYQGVDDIRGKPLCPVVVQPQHFIREVVSDEQAHQRYKLAKLRRGRWLHLADVASKTLTRGTFFSAIFGWFSLPSLIVRSLSPRAYLRWEHFLRGHIPKPISRLQIERECDSDGPIKIGYSIREMCEIVENTLRTMNLLGQYSPIVVFVGHGSSSLNNPHEAAHDCGATGGGRGGPNARVFAAMANHPMVRQTLAERDLIISPETWFVGAYHNTCDDVMTYYDEDLIPAPLLDCFKLVKDAFNRACVLDAHERCRRFETTPLSLSPQQALEYARVHANDLAEPRPEYGHATNSLCVVGRRSRTRGLFLDRRAFLVSYDSTVDATGDILRELLLSVGPVGAGINLEYYFSFVDPAGYGCGSKLPHNITGLIGVMDGHASDLRTGLPWQMVEIHEPVRLLLVVEAKLQILEKILNRAPALARLINNHWIQLVALDPDSEACSVYTEQGFRPYILQKTQLVECENSRDYYLGHRDHLPPAHVAASL